MAFCEPGAAHTKRSISIIRFEMRGYILLFVWLTDLWPTCEEGSRMVESRRDPFSRDEEGSRTSFLSIAFISQGRRLLYDLGCASDPSM